MTLGLKVWVSSTVLRDVLFTEQAQRDATRAVTIMIQLGEALPMGCNLDPLCSTWHPKPRFGQMRGAGHGFEAVLLGFFVQASPEKSPSLLMVNTHQKRNSKTRLGLPESG
jgi:hypothetical protein